MIRVTWKILSRCCQVHLHWRCCQRLGWEQPMELCGDIGDVTIQNHSDQSICYRCLRCPRIRIHQCRRYQQVLTGRKFNFGRKIMKIWKMKIFKFLYVNLLKCVTLLVWIYWLLYVQNCTRQIYIMFVILIYKASYMCMCEYWCPAVSHTKVSHREASHTP